jgi:hypothetical protein
MINEKTSLLLLGIAAVLSVVLAPSLVPTASADPAPKTEENCTQDTGGGERESDGECPGKSNENNKNKDEECTPRNRGHEDDCAGAEVIEDPVNPPDKN